MKKSNTGKIVAIILIIALALGGGAYYLISNKIIPFGNGKVESTYVDLGDFTIKLDSEKEKRFFKGKIYVGYDKSDWTAKKELTREKQLPIISDTINTYFRGKTYEELDDVNNIEKIKDELTEKINENLETCKITNVKFYNYVLQ